MKTILQQEQINKLHEFGIDAVRLTDLLSILPKKITDRKRIYELRVWIDHYSDNWCIKYTHFSEVNDFEDSFVSAEDLCDAVYQEICFLKTEKIQEL